VLLAFFLVATLAAVTLDGSARAGVAIALVVLLVAYCVARPNGGVDVFLIAAAPNAIGAILEEVAGTPSWLAIVFVPIALFLARDADKTDGRTPPSASAPARP
jgi:hypothetical protein